MTTYFVTRHKGAIDWARQQGLEAQHVTHFDLATITKGDTVLGTLPVNIAAQICAIGARYFHLTLNIPEHLRGQELSAQDMADFGARLVRYYCAQLPEETGAPNE